MESPEEKEFLRGIGLEKTKGILTIV